MRMMADSTNLDDIPVGKFPLILYYVDYLFDAAKVARHATAGSIMVPITVGLNPLNAVVLDIETSDYTPAESVDAVLVQRAKGIDPTGYCNLSTWPAVRAAFSARGVREPHYLIAAYPGIGAAIYPGAIGHQYLNDAAGTGHYSGGHYDVSIVADFWPGVDNVFGPGGGSIGDNEVLSNTDPVVLDILAYLDRLDTNVKDLYFALGLPQPNPADPTTAKSAVLEDIRTRIAALPTTGGSPEPVEPKTLTLTLPAQVITGSLS